MILASTTTSLTFLLPRMALALGVVLLCIWAAGVIVRKRDRFLGTRSLGMERPLEVVHRYPLGKRKELLVVRVGEQMIVVGMTDHTITQLTTLDTPTTETHTYRNRSPLTTEPHRTGVAVDLRPSWKGLLDSARERTVRRT